LGNVRINRASSVTRGKCVSKSAYPHYRTVIDVLPDIETVEDVVPAVDGMDAGFSDFIRIESAINVTWFASNGIVDEEDGFPLFELIHEGFQFIHWDMVTITDQQPRLRGLLQMRDMGDVPIPKLVQERR
jgi:hypothetical protein